MACWASRHTVYLVWVCRQLKKIDGKNLRQEMEKGTGRVAIQRNIGTVILPFTASQVLVNSITAHAAM